MSAARPLASVVVPVFNAGPLLHKAVASLLRQSLDDLEILAVDDGSTDGSRDVLHDLAASDPRLRVILHDENRRTPCARNTGIAAARGEFLAFQNHDDYAEPTRLERQVEALRGDAGHGAVVSAVDFSDPDGRPIGRPAIPPSDPVELRWRALTDSPFHPSSLMVRNSLLHRHGQLRFDSAVPHRSDYAFNTLLLSVTTVSVIPDVLVHYVLHTRSLSRRSAVAMHRESDIISHRAIQQELPGNGLSLADVAEMRSIVLHLPGDFSRDLRTVKRAWGHYWQLFDAFRRKYGLDATQSMTALPQDTPR